MRYPGFQVFGVLAHGAELVEHEPAPVQAAANLAENGWAVRSQPHQGRDRRHERRQHQQACAGDYDIEYTLHQETDLVMGDGGKREQWRGVQAVQRNGAVDVREEIHRYPGADANPYLAIAAILAAGLEELGYELAHPDFFDTLCVRTATGGTNVPTAAKIISAARERGINLREHSGDVIIALDDDQRMRWALMSVPSISFYSYQVSFKLLKA